MAKISVKDTQVSVIKIQNEDYICLTDMLKAKDGQFFFYNWLRNRNTIEFLGIWERLKRLNEMAIRHMEILVSNEGHHILK